MNVKVKISSTQIPKDNKTVNQTSMCDGKIEYHNKGTILEFVEKYEDQELKFKMTILENKIITSRNGEYMIFDCKNKHKTVLNTQYGQLSMVITTKQVNVEKIENNIKNIHLKYNICLEENIDYDNIVDIEIL